MTVGPFLRKSRLTQMVRILSSAVLNGVNVIVITRPESDFKEANRMIVQSNTEHLRAAGIRVQYKPKIHRKFCVMHAKIVWYGSINLLSFGSAQESIMRWDNNEMQMNCMIPCEIFERL